jgi:hypothetical protein
METNGDGKVVRTTQQKSPISGTLSAGHRSWWNICRVRELSAIGRERPSDGVLLSS